MGLNDVAFMRRVSAHNRRERAKLWRTFKTRAGAEASPHFTFTPYGDLDEQKRKQLLKCGALPEQIQR
jgi:2'-5' RNA ligase